MLTGAQMGLLQFHYQVGYVEQRSWLKMQLVVEADSRQPQVAVPSCERPQASSIADQKYTLYAML
jgi:hypothetical protein